MLDHLSVLKATNIDYGNREGPLSCGPTHERPSVCTPSGDACPGLISTSHDFLNGCFKSGLAVRRLTMAPFTPSTLGEKAVVHRQPTAPHVANGSVLDVYHRPYDPKRPQISFAKAATLLDTPRGQLPVVPEQGIRHDYEYTRQGACNIGSCWPRALTGWRCPGHGPRRPTTRPVPAGIRGRYRPEAYTLVLVADIRHAPSAC